MNTDIDRSRGTASDFFFSLFWCLSLLSAPRRRSYSSSLCTAVCAGFTRAQSGIFKARRIQ